MDVVRATLHPLSFGEAALRGVLAAHADRARAVGVAARLLEVEGAPAGVSFVLELAFRDRAARERSPLVGHLLAAVAPLTRAPAEVRLGDAALLAP
jgi:hypothetical protein